jgi:hypothetical protein
MKAKKRPQEDHNYCMECRSRIMPGIAFCPSKDCSTIYHIRKMKREQELRDFIISARFELSCM